MNNKTPQALKAESSTSRSKSLLSLISGFVSLFILSTAYGYVWFGYYAERSKVQFDRRGHWLIIAVYAILLFVVTRMYGGYKVGNATRGNLIYSCVLSTLFVNAITYLQISLLCLGFPNILPMLVLCVVDIVIIIIWAAIVKALSYKLFPPQRMLMIYGTHLPEDLVSKLNTRPDRYNICSTICMDQGLDAVLERMADFDAVFICEVKSKHRNTLVKFCYDQNMRTYVVPKISDIIIRGADMLDLFDTPILLSRNRGLSTEQRIAKRIFDIAFSSFAILISSPIMLVCAIAIKICDGGPVLFRQDRCTIDGKVFSICKFRSMIVDAEKNGARPAEKDDERITSVGKVLRLTRLDELPQLFNIFKGDMSVVGPRPERVEHVEKFVKDIPEFNFRMRVKGGLTGYAQVVGKYNTTPLDKVKMDLIYIENYSFLLDLRLILMTIKIMFMKESTEGFDAPTEIPQIDLDKNNDEN